VVQWCGVLCRAAEDEQLHALPTAAEALAAHGARQVPFGACEDFGGSYCGSEGAPGGPRGSQIPNRVPGALDSWVAGGPEGPRGVGTDGSVPRGKMPGSGVGSVGWGRWGQQ
jgi:hypothetical protein